MQKDKSYPCKTCWKQAICDDWDRCSCPRMRRYYDYIDAEAEAPRVKEEERELER